ncbi:MAG: secretin and TonB N-terminal domain-containing protein [Desulfopila sp.]
MYPRSAHSQLALLSALFVFLTCHCTTVFARQPQSTTAGPAYHISELKSSYAQKTLTITLKGDAVPIYTVSERFAPYRVIVDIAGASLAPSLPATTLLPENPVASMSLQPLLDQQQPVGRFTIDLDEGYRYQVTRNDNDLQIVLAPAAQIAQSTPIASPVAAITDFKVETRPDETLISLVGTGTFTDYKVGTVPGVGEGHASMFVDIPDVSIAELVPELQIGTAITSVEAIPQGKGARFLFHSATDELFGYDVRAVPRGIDVRIHEHIADLPANIRTVAATKSDTMSNATLDELIESSSDLVTDNEPAESAASTMQDNFSFAGYKNKRISVDFYKIDIHNVFRLFRQITSLNIIVDEDVKGTLTLALNDVPWDFALDIILNLMDLEKVERFNTIVIYPKKKEFVWPERAMDNLSFQADATAPQDALIIEQSASVSKEIMQAKDILRKATLAEKNQKYEDAAALYEQAAPLWPTNANIYNKLATLNLLNLGNNAKAVFYAQKGLKAEPRNRSSALYAAIGSANMNKPQDAAEYFTQAISGNPPMKEALFSFAAFNENQRQYGAALKLLDKYVRYHGETVETMLAKARIYDKMGDSAKADQQYRALAASGYPLSPDLRDYISARVANNQ